MIHDVTTINAHRGRLEAIAFKIIRDSHAAEDVAQDAIVKALGRDIKNLEGWLTLTVKRSARKWHPNWRPTLFLGLVEAVAPPSSALVDSFLRRLPRQLMLDLAGEAEGSVSTKRRRKLLAIEEFKRLWTHNDYQSKD